MFLEVIDLDGFYKLILKHSDKIKKIFITCCVVVLLPELEVIKRTTINILLFMEEKDLLLLFGGSVKDIEIKYSYIRTH